MGKYFTGLVKFTAVFLAILFVIATLFALFLYNVEKRAFDADVYKEALLDEEIYARLPGLIGEQLVSSMNFDPCAYSLITCGLEQRSYSIDVCLEDRLGEEAYKSITNFEREPTGVENRRADSCFEEYGFPKPAAEEGGASAYTENMTAKDWELLIAVLVPPEEMKAMAEEALDETFNYLNGRGLSAEVSLVRIKDRLHGEEGTEAAMQFLSAQPPCTAQDLLQLSNMLNEEIIYCNPPEASLALLRPTLNLLTIIENGIPDQFQIIKPASGNNPLAGVQRLRFMMRMSPLVSMGLLFLMTLLIVRTPKGWLRWWGIPMLIAGALGLVVGVAIMPIFQFIANRFLYNQLPVHISLGLVELGTDLAASVVHGLSEIIVLQALLIGILGLSMTIGAIFIKQETIQR
ncbi:MAG: hypothetical protein B6I38_04085 [Anaerolineaceae bacterium 4572_5.1]|nr:MAG: hypothetical protein B6I38_04085 [Anaerolineaceae bacterium 4572_5.1]